jgi:hypothetical protein
LSCDRDAMKLDLTNLIPVMIDRKQGIRLPLIPPEEAERPYSSAGVAIAEKSRRKAALQNRWPVDNAADQTDKRCLHHVPSVSVNQQLELSMRAGYNCLH